MISFGEDLLDQTPTLLDCLQKRQDDASERLHLKGDHLTPASIGLRKEVLGEWADDNSRTKNLKELAKEIVDWSCS